MSGSEELSSDALAPCRRCGEPVGDFQFCLSCGASVTDAVTDAGERADEPASGLRGLLRKVARWRTPIVVIPSLVALAVVGGLGAQMLTAEIVPPEVEPEVICWDGEVVGSSGDCSAPSGVAGLRWVFPGFRPGRDDCVDVLIAHPEYARPTMYECETEVAGEQVTIAYMQLADVVAGRRYFEKTFTGEREKVRTADGAPSRYVWRQRGDDGFELASMYTDFPYAVTVTADRPRLRDRAQRGLDFRHPDKISVRGE